jgi:hypothetical protein
MNEVCNTSVISELGCKDTVNPPQEKSNCFCLPFMGHAVREGVPNKAQRRQFRPQSGPGAKAGGNLSLAEVPSYPKI